MSTNGAYDTNVIANLFFNKLFAASEAGQASAIVVVTLPRRLVERPGAAAGVNRHWMIESSDSLKLWRLGLPD